MNLSIRRAAFPADYAGIAGVLSAECPEWPTTVADLAHQDQVRDTRFYRAVFVAEEAASGAEQLIGVASVGHNTQAHREGKFKLDIRVRPDMWGRGAGARLYQALMAHLAPLAPCELYTEVWAAHPRAVRFVTERGFVAVWERVDSRLDVSRFDCTPYAGLEERVHALGIDIQTYAELEHDPERLKKFYTLDRLLWRDVPFGEPLTPLSLEQFEKEEVQAARFIPDACFIAVQEGAFVGYSNLTRSGAYYDTEMTGVLPMYRGKGVATLLKLYGIRYAQAHGNREIWTVNDSVNRAAFALNARLGFQRQGATIRFVKRDPERDR
ncbi:MAG: GNAT family N-acetyltransferase [Ktedonobacteraceae bacterium]|nr:GNAT family N-acetyltransferase [Ktedonobacteraceae bacterium]